MLVIDGGQCCSPKHLELTHKNIGATKYILTFFLNVLIYINTKRIYHIFNVLNPRNSHYSLLEDLHSGVGKNPPPYPLLDHSHITKGQSEIYNYINILFKTII